MSASGELNVRLEVGCEAELDKQRPYVGNKSNQRWLWYAVDHTTKPCGLICLASVWMKFSKNSKRCLSYSVSAVTTQMTGVHMNAISMPTSMRWISAIPKNRIQKPKLQNLDKLLARKTICFSKQELLHDTVIDLLINKVEFGLKIYT
ncbi:MAG: IS1 family transposase [Methylococcaceae bacterium]|nr:IS1 family transposase [Methylococcaceae bacterium]